MKNINNLKKVNFFSGEKYSVITSTTSTIIEIIIISLLVFNLYYHISKLSYSFSISDIIKILLTPWVLISLVSLVVYYLFLKRKIYLTLEGYKTFSELLSLYWFVFTNKKKIKKKKFQSIKLKSI